MTGGPTEAFDGKLVFSMGCHAGLSVSDVFVVSPLGTPTGRRPTRSAAAPTRASSGYAYGDGKLVAYSEDLHRRFAENLGGFAVPGDLTIGEAIVLAKQDYFGELGLVGVYDEKASSEFTLYGLPMWQIGGAAAAAAPASAPARRSRGDRRARGRGRTDVRHPVGADRPGARRRARDRADGRAADDRLDAAAGDAGARAPARTSSAWTACR